MSTRNTRPEERRPRVRRPKSWLRQTAYATARACQKQAAPAACRTHQLLVSSHVEGSPGNGRRRRVGNDWRLVQPQRTRLVQIQKLIHLRAQQSTGRQTHTSDEGSRVAICSCCSFCSFSARAAGRLRTRYHSHTLHVTTVSDMPALTIA